MAIRRKKLLTSLVFIFFLAFTTVGAKASDGEHVTYGFLKDIPESQGNWVWKAGPHSVCQQWSLAVPDRSGWFYGTSHGWSSGDVYLLKGPSDPLKVTNAAAFKFETESVLAEKGDTIFFRDDKSHYGALKITEIKDGKLSGTWYLSHNDRGDFSQHLEKSLDPPRNEACK